MNQTANNIVELDIISSADTNKNNLRSHCYLSLFYPEPSKYNENSVALLFSFFIKFTRNKKYI